MMRQFDAWEVAATAAGQHFTSPLSVEQREAAVDLLARGQPIIVDQVILKVEPCEWKPAPEGTPRDGYQVFCRNELGAYGAEEYGHPEPLERSRLAAAVEWAERQKCSPDEPEWPY